ncbi:MAG TPA: glycosyltransferase family A protein [Gammaproteobacteria bacterium]
MIAKVSIVITAYNAERYIGASVNAALAQRYPNYEVLVVDDGSTDNTEQICRSFRDAKLNFYKFDRIGRSRALNEGIRRAGGEFIAINDADDISLPGRLQCAVDFFKANPSTVLLGTGYIESPVFHENIPDKLLLYSGVGFPTWIDDKRVYRNNPYIHSTVVFSKHVWQQAGGYDESLPMCVDYDFFLRAKRFGKFAYLPQQTLLYYTNPQSYFKKKSYNEYLQTNLHIRKRARNELKLPLWASVMDFVQYYQYARMVAKNFLSRNCN